MGRSVSYLSRAQGVIYFDVTPMGQEEVFKCEECGLVEYEPGVCPDDRRELLMEMEQDEDRGRMDWQDFVSNIRELLKKKYKSLDDADSWDGRETSIILKNSLCEIGLSEYFGLASLSIRPVEDDDNDQHTGNFAPTWIDRSWPGMVKVLDKGIGYSRYYRAGGFSDGTSLYNKAA